jgi:hypothetical protein
MNKLTTLWDTRKLHGDSTVLTDGKRCFKLYQEDHYSERDILFYQDTQNSLTSTILVFPDGIDIGTWVLIKEFKINFLHLDSQIYKTSDIIDKTLLLVTEVLFKKGRTIASCLLNGVTSQDIANGTLFKKLYNITPLLSGIQEYIHKETCLGMATTENNILQPWLQFQINPYNIKIEKISSRDWTAELTITDICMQISEFIQKNRDSIPG